MGRDNWLIFFFLSIAAITACGLALLLHFVFKRDEWLYFSVFYVAGMMVCGIALFVYFIFISG